MEIKKWIPWNWFKNEEEESGEIIPVKSKPIHAQDRFFFSPVQRLHEKMDQIFDETFKGLSSSSFGNEPGLFSGINSAFLKPSLDLGATDKEYTITMEVSGIDEKNINIEISNDTLTISGEKKQENEEKDKNYYRMERSYGSFKRMLALPEDADQDSIKAVFKKGVLTITLFRKPLPESEVKHIEVKSA